MCSREEPELEEEEEEEEEEQLMPSVSSLRQRLAKSSSRNRCLSVAFAFTAAA